MISIAICDDEQVHIDILRNYIEESMSRLGEEYRILEFITPDRLLDAIDEYNILFLDLMLGNKIDGMYVAQKLREKGYAQALVFVTSLKHRATQGYRYKALGYITKPINRQEVFETVQFSVNELKNSPDRLIIKFKGTTSFIPLESIYYIESYYGKRKIYTVTDIYETNQKLDELMSQLPKHQFAMANHSCCVNLGKVKDLDVTDVLIENGKMIKLGRGAKKDFEVALYLFSRGMKYDSIYVER